MPSYLLDLDLKVIVLPNFGLFQVVITDPVMTNGGDNSLWADITTKAQSEIRVMIININNTTLMIFYRNN